MLRLPKEQFFFRYLIAVAVSGLAVAVIAVLQPMVGFLELLYLAAVAFVDAYAGEGPAALTIVLCSLGSLKVIGADHVFHERVHDITKLAVFPLVAASLIYLMRSRRRQKRESSEQLTELSTLLESIPEAVFIFDADGRIAEVNSAAVDLCARGRDDLLRSSIDELAGSLRIERDNAPLTGADLAVSRALRGETLRDERRICHNCDDGEPRNLLVSAYPMRSEEGEIIGALVVLRDVTEITRMQQSIAATERHVVLGQMASSIAHDFNNVLNTIQEAAAVLELPADQVEGDRHVYVGLINKAVRRGAEVVQRLREYVRGGSGELVSVDVRHLLEEVLELTRPLLQTSKRILLKTDLKPVDPVHANQADLRRVFTNLVINAIQAMPEGGELKITTGQRLDKVQIAIKDTGSGIDPDKRKKIFLPYYTTKSTGTGLGLSTAQKILLAQGGNISFTSERGQGTCFVVELPAIAQQKPLRAA